jgi:uncharacterized protein involved in type VI secretion and phage assembly
MFDDLIAILHDKIERRYFGKYKAFVSDNADPENRGRLRLQIPSVLGTDVVSGWALPCAPFGGMNGQGFFFIPEPKAGVWVEFEEGCLDQPIWTGTFWSKPGGMTEVPDPGGGQMPPTSKIIKTTNHTIELADGTGGEAIKIIDAKNKNTITIDSSGITVQDNFGNQVTLASSALTLKSANIKIGDSAGPEKLVLGTTLNTILSAWFSALMSHTHIGNLGAPTSPPMGPPFVPPALQMSIDTALSQKHTVE